MIFPIVLLLLQAGMICLLLADMKQSYKDRSYLVFFGGLCLVVALSITFYCTTRLF